MTREVTNDIVPPLVTLIAVLVLPYGYAQTMAIGGTAHITAAVFWSYASTFYRSVLMVNALGDIITAQPYVVLRFLTVYQVYRFYRGSSTRGRTVAFASISELPPLFLSLPLVFGFPSSLGLLYDFVLPLPTLLVFVLILVFAFSPKQPKTAW